MTQRFTSSHGALASIAVAAVLIFTFGPRFDYRLSPQWLFKSSKPSRELLELRECSRVGRWLSDEFASRLQDGKNVANDNDWSDIIEFLHLDGISGVPTTFPNEGKSGWRALSCDAKSAAQPELLVLHWKGDAGELFFSLDGRVHYGNDRLLQGASLGKWVSSDGVLFANEDALNDWNRTHQTVSEDGQPMSSSHDEINFNYDFTPFGIRVQISTPNGVIRETVDIVENSGAIAVSREPDDWENIWRNSVSNE